MANAVTLGEIMLRLSPPGNQRFIQASSFDICYGGAEANVAGTLSQLGHNTIFLSALPSNALGDAAVCSLRSLGVDCSHITRCGNRIGVYYLENGASVRPSGVIYDRTGSSITEAGPDDFDFDEIFTHADLFHITGITPILSPNTARLALTAVKKAKEHGVCVSFDLNCRAKLWTEDITRKQAVLSEIMQYADICFGNARDAAKCLGYSVPGTDFITGDYGICVNEENMRRIAEHYGLKCVVTTLRENRSASDNGWCAAVFAHGHLITGTQYDLHIVDRVGGGDAFAAGFIHGYLQNVGPERALEFGIATAAIKHTVPGDMNYVTEKEVLALINNKGNGRVIR